MNCQINWKHWHWFWHNALYDADYGEHYNHFAGIGPFQFRWHSNKACF